MFAGLRLWTPRPLEILELKVLDLRFALRGARPAPSDLVIVGIDEPSLARFGRWPWPRVRLAELVDRLTALGARTIAFDAVFDLPDPAGDATFAAALRASGRVVLGEFFDFGDATGSDTAPFPELSLRDRGDGLQQLRDAKGRHGPIPAFAAAAAGIGHVNFVTDPDQACRRVPLAIRMGDRVAPAFAVAALTHFLGGRGAVLTVGGAIDARLAVGDRELPLDPSSDLRIDFLGPSEAIPHVSALEVLERRARREALEGKLALVAATAVGLDSRPTPFAAAAPGVEIHASVVDDLLRGRGLVRPAWLVPVEAAVTVALGLATGLLIQWRAFAGAVGALALFALYLAATQVAFATAGLVAAVVYPYGAVVTGTIVGLVQQYLTEARKREYIRGAFQHYLDAEVVERLAARPESLRLGGERRDLTILFTDIRGFSSISQMLPPERLGELLTEHLGAQTEIVLRHGGLLDKYIGDAVMAFWGAPNDVPDHATRACQAGLDIVAAMPVLRAHWRSRGLPAIDIGVGIASGDAVVGNFGSAERFNYTVISDAVNLASRLEGLNKLYKTRILISEATRERIGDEFVCREIDRVRPKGMQQAVTIYELLCHRRHDGSGRAAQIAGAFSQAFMAYRARRFTDAIAAVEAVRNLDPDDAVITTFAARCRELIAAPPPEAWDGVYDALTK